MDGREGRQRRCRRGVLVLTLLAWGPGAASAADPMAQNVRLWNVSHRFAVSAAVRSASRRVLDPEGHARGTTSGELAAQPSA